MNKDVRAYFPLNEAVEMINAKLSDKIPSEKIVRDIIHLAKISGFNLIVQYPGRPHYFVPKDEISNFEANYYNHPNSSYKLKKIFWINEQDKFDSLSLDQKDQIDLTTRNLFILSSDLNKYFDVYRSSFSPEQNIGIGKLKLEDLPTKLKCVIEAYYNFWSNAEPGDGSDWSENKDVENWLIDEKNFARDAANEAAELVRPDFAVGIKKPPKKT